jgi:hypothetical protein
MRTIKEKWVKTYGYTPTDNEILNAYQCGNIQLTDKEENELIKHFKL